MIYTALERKLDLVTRDRFSASPPNLTIHLKRCIVVNGGFMHYLVELKIEITASDDEIAKKAHEAIVSAALSTACRVSGLTTCTLQKLTSQNRRVVEEFTHPMQHAIFP